MKRIERPIYLKRLADRRENGAIKVITGIRRSGKSYLLFDIYKDYLINEGVKSKNIIEIPLDDDDFEEYRDRKQLSAYIKEQLTDKEMNYIFLDEVQLCTGFEGVLNGLNRRSNVDIYVTGSNSKFLSSDIITEFRGRGDEIRVYPLSFSEFFSAYSGEKAEAWYEYLTYGGLPIILTAKTEEQKSKYLHDLLENMYIRDIIDRNNLQNDSVMEALVNILSSSVGSLTNPKKLANTFNSNGISVSDKTVSSYISYLIDGFFISKAQRYDIKGKKYINSPFKYYFTDVGIRNAQLNFRQQEPTHIMENIIYNELLLRGYNVDVGVVEKTVKTENNKQARKQLEIDFVCNKGSMRYYIQSAFAIPDGEKMAQETAPFSSTGDSFKKIIVVNDAIRPWHTEKGYTVIGIMDFLLNENSLEM